MEQKLWHFHHKHYVYQKVQNKKFLDKMSTKFLWLVAGITAAVAAGIGIHSAIGGGEQLPQIEDDDDKSDDVE